jgi:hypothetical protein
VIVAKELTVGSKTMLASFFVVDVKGHYNVLLGWDWIHANECVPPTLHQHIVQWVGDRVEITEADDSKCVAMAESHVNIQGGEMGCLWGQDLMGYDYVSVNKNGFIPITVKLMMSETRLLNGVV